jgi:hypothetical protein
MSNEATDEQRCIKDAFDTYLDLWFVLRNFLKKAKVLPPLIETESFGCFLWMVNLLCGQRHHGSPAG